MSTGLFTGICTTCGESVATTIDPHWIGHEDAQQLDVDEGDFHPECCPHPDCLCLHREIEGPLEDVNDTTDV